MQRYPLILAIVAVGILFMPAQSFARFDYTPRLSLSEEYNDNIYLAADNLESDFITTIIPGISLDWVAKAASLKLDYSLEFRKYAENDSQDQTALKDIQRGLMLGELFPGRDFSITALQDFSTETVDSRLPSVADNTSVNRTNVSRSIINPLYRHQFTPKLLALLDYRFERLAYTYPDSDDVLSHNFRLELKRRVSQSLELLIGGDAGIFNNSQNDDYDRYSAYAGLSSQLSSKISFNIIGGQSWIDFDHDYIKSELIGDALLLFDIARGVSVGIGSSQDFGYEALDGVYLRSLSRIVLGWNLESGYAGSSLYAWGNKYSDVGSTRLLGRQSVSERQRSSLVLNIYTSQNQFYSSTREDKETGLLIGGDLYLGDDWHMLTGGKLAELKLNPGDANVTRFGLDAGAEYRKSRYTFSLRYLYQQDDSDLAGNDFENNIVVLQVAIEL